MKLAQCTHLAPLRVPASVEYQVVYSMAKAVPSAAADISCSFPQPQDEVLHHQHGRHNNGPTASCIQISLRLW